MQQVSWQGYVKYVPSAAVGIGAPVSGSMTPPVCWPAPSVVTGFIAKSPRQPEARLRSGPENGEHRVQPPRSRSAPHGSTYPPTLPRPRTLLKVEVLPAGKSRQSGYGEASCLVDLTNRPLEIDRSWQPEPSPKVMTPVSYVVTPTVTAPIDATWSSTSTMLVAPGRPLDASPLAVNSWQSEASTVAVPSVFPRPMAVSSGTQTDQGTDSTEASPLPAMSPGWTQLLAEKARYLEQNGPLSEPSMEDDVKVAEMILRPVSESLEKLRCSIEASTATCGHGHVEVLPPMRGPRGPVSFSPKATSRSSSCSSVPALLRSEMLATEDAMEDEVGSCGSPEGEAFSSTLAVLTRLDNELGNLEAVLRALEPMERVRTRSASPRSPTTGTAKECQMLQ